MTTFGAVSHLPSPLTDGGMDVFTPCKFKFWVRLKKEVHEQMKYKMDL